MNLLNLDLLNLCRSMLDNRMDLGYTHSSTPSVYYLSYLSYRRDVDFWTYANLFISLKSSSQRSIQPMLWWLMAAPSDHLVAANSDCKPVWIIGVAKAQVFTPRVDHAYALTFVQDYPRAIHWLHVHSTSVPRRGVTLSLTSWSTSTIWKT